MTPCNGFKASKFKQRWLATTLVKLVKTGIVLGQPSYQYNPVLNACVHAVV